MTEEMPLVHIVDDDPDVRQTLKRLIEAAGMDVLTFDSAVSLLEGLEPEGPGCIVLDICMPGMDGLALQEELNYRKIGLPVVVITGFGDVPKAIKAMKGGAVDFLEKPLSSEVLLNSIRKAIAESRAAHESGNRRREAIARLELLTIRERVVFDLLVEGLSNKEIAQRLHRSERTIEVHRRHIKAKLSLETVAEMVRCKFLASQ